MRIIKTLFLFSFITIMSCENSYNEFSKDISESKNSSRVALGCGVSIAGPTEVDSEPFDQVIEYSTLISGDFTNPSISWSTSGTGIMIPFGSSGASVDVTFTRKFESGTLTAEVTENGETCSQTLFIDSNGSGVGSNCGENDDFDIVENIEPCYPSIHPHGRYTLLGSSGESTQWSVLNATIHGFSDDYIVVEPTSIGGYTITAEITYDSGCTYTYSEDFYAESCN